MWSLSIESDIFFSWKLSNGCLPLYLMKRSKTRWNQGRRFSKNQSTKTSLWLLIHARRAFKSSWFYCQLSYFKRKLPWKLSEDRRQWARVCAAPSPADSSVRFVRLRSSTFFAKAKTIYTDLLHPQNYTRESAGSSSSLWKMTRRRLLSR